MPKSWRGRGQSNNSWWWHDYDWDRGTDGGVRIIVEGHH